MIFINNNKWVQETFLVDVEIAGETTIQFVAVRGITGRTESFISIHILPTKIGKKMVIAVVFDARLYISTSNGTL